MIYIKLFLEFWVERKLLRPWAVYRITLNVRLIRSLIGLAVFGIWCNQLCWVFPCINKRLPFSRKILCFSSLLYLCFKWKMRSCPRLNEAMIGFLPSSFSSSACHPLLSLPSRYRLSRHALNSNWVAPSIFAFMSSNSELKGFGFMVRPE